MSRTHITTHWLVLLIAQATALAEAPVPLPGVAPPVEAAAKVDGLEFVGGDRQAKPGSLVVLEVQSPGDVQFLVLATEGKVEYVTAGKSVVFAQPATGTVYVYGVAVVGGKLTPFARCVVTTAGSPAPAPGPGPPEPGPAQLIKGRLHVTVIEDPAQRSREIAAVVTSPNLPESLKARGHVWRVYDVNDPQVKAKRLDVAVQRAGGVPALVIQTDDGVVQYAGKLPADEPGVLAVVRRLTGQ
jgi:hypothetical protein